MGGDVHVLVAGNELLALLLRPLPSWHGVSKVRCADDDDAMFERPLAENMAALIVSRSMDGYDALVLAAATTKFGKNILPACRGCHAGRDAPSPISSADRKDADTFERPIYAGNAIADRAGNRCEEDRLTVRMTAFKDFATTE